MALCYGVNPGHRPSDVASTSQRLDVSELELKLDAALKENIVLREQNSQLSLELERIQAMENTCTECIRLRSAHDEAEAISTASYNQAIDAENLIVFFYQEKVRVAEDLALKAQSARYAANVALREAEAEVRGAC